MVNKGYKQTAEHIHNRTKNQSTILKGRKMPWVSESNKKRRIWKEMVIMCPCGNRVITCDCPKKRKYCSMQCRNKYANNEGINATHKRHTKETKRLKKEECDFCKSKRHLDLHHLDLNFRNNNPENIVTMCRCCHNLIHGRVGPIKKGGKR